MGVYLELCACTDMIAILCPVEGMQLIIDSTSEREMQTTSSRLEEDQSKRCNSETSMHKSSYWNRLFELKYNLFILNIEPDRFVRDITQVFMVEFHSSDIQIDAIQSDLIDRFIDLE